MATNWAYWCPLPGWTGRTGRAGVRMSPRGGVVGGWVRFAVSGTNFPQSDARCVGMGGMGDWGGGVPAASVSPSRGAPSGCTASGKFRRGSSPHRTPRGVAGPTARAHACTLTRVHDRVLVRPHNHAPVPDRALAHVSPCTRRCSALREAAASHGGEAARSCALARLHNSMFTHVWLRFHVSILRHVLALLHDGVFTRVLTWLHNGMVARRCVHRHVLVFAQRCVSHVLMQLHDSAFTDVCLHGYTMICLQACAHDCTMACSQMCLWLHNSVFTDMCLQLQDGVFAGVCSHCTMPCLQVCAHVFAQ